MHSYTRTASHTQQSLRVASMGESKRDDTKSVHKVCIIFLQCCCYFAAAGGSHLTCTSVTKTDHLDDEKTSSADSFFAQNL